MKWKLWLWWYSLVNILDANKTCVIINVVDQNRALVDGPSSVTGVGRQVLNFKDLLMTNLKCQIPVNARLSTLLRAYTKAEIAKKWATSALNKKIQQRQTRANLTDFQRFQVMTLKRKRSSQVNATFRTMKKAQGKLTLAPNKKAAAAKKEAEEVAALIKKMAPQPKKEEAKGKGKK